MDRKSRGLCFRCGEKFHPLHRCAERQLQLIVLGDHEMVNEHGEIIALEVENDEGRADVECNSMGAR